MEDVSDHPDTVVLAFVEFVELYRAHLEADRFGIDIPNLLNLFAKHLQVSPEAITESVKDMSARSKVLSDMGIDLVPVSDWSEVNPSSE